MRSTKDPVKELPPNKKFKLPPWAEENLAALGLGFIGVIFAITLLLRGNSAPAATAKIEKIVGPLSVFAPGSDTKLESVKVTVRNLGPETAKNVSITLRVMGSSFAMVGPAQIPPNTTADYVTQKVNVDLAKGEVPAMFAQCSNC